MKGYHLWVTPHIAYGHPRRPMGLRRLIQRVLLGWRWIPASQVYGLVANGPELPNYCIDSPEHLPTVTKRVEDE